MLRRSCLFRRGRGAAKAPPRPVFTLAPSIAPGSGTEEATVFTASSGFAKFALTYTRRWLLNDAPIGTAETVVPAEPGILVLEITAIGPGGSTVALSAEALVVPAPVATIPTIEPGMAWAGEYTAAPAASEVAFGSVDPWIQASVNFRAFDFQVITDLTYITIVPGTIAADGIDRVFAGCEGSPERECFFGQNPQDLSWGYIFAVRSRTAAARNGLATVYVRVQPKNGLERVHAKMLVLNSDPAGAGYIQTAMRYVDSGAGGSDAANGLGWATAQKSVWKAIDSFSAADCSDKICRVIMKGGQTHPWYRNVGYNAGNRKTFKYRPWFSGQGRKGAPLETRLSMQTQMEFPPSYPSGQGLQSYTWRSETAGARPLYTDMWIDRGDTVTASHGHVCGRFDMTGRDGPLGPDDKGYPTALHDSESGGVALGSQTFTDNNSGGAPTPGQTGRWGGHRYTWFDYTFTGFIIQDVQERWDGIEKTSADCVFIHQEGDWLIDNVQQIQVKNGESRNHLELDLIVTNVEANTPAAGQTTLTFTGTWTSFRTSGDVTKMVADGNQWLRVLEDANGTPVGNTPYQIDPDGGQLYPSMGWKLDEEVSTPTAKKLVVNNAINPAIGAKLRAYGVYHGDSGQFNWDAGGANRECRDNFIFNRRRAVSANWQRYLFQIGAVAAGGTTSGSYGTAPIITGKTISTGAGGNPRIATCSDVLPAALKKHCWIVARSGTYDQAGANGQMRRVVRIIDANTVELEEGFPTNLPAGTQFGVFRGVHGFVEMNGIGHKSDASAQIVQIEPGLSGSGFVDCTFPGWTSGGAAFASRARGSKRGGFGLRFINSILHDFSSGDGGEPVPSDVEFINCHVDRRLPAANAVRSGVSTGYVFGGNDNGVGDPNFAHANAYLPGAGMTRTVPAVLNRRDILGNLRSAGSRIGAIAG